MDFLPQHVAIIPDGNRRWAKERNQSALDGHTAGTKTLRQVSLHAAARGVKYLSMWGMSVGNFTKRNPIEITGLLNIFRNEFNSLAEDPEVHRLQARIQVFGLWAEKFPLPVRSAIIKAQTATQQYSQHYLNFFLAYSGTDEMVQAVQAIADQAKKDSSLVVTPELIKANLLTKDLPPVDLLIRTGGEPHLSAGFMMWDVADSQLYFTENFCPDFGPDQFDEALTDYAQRGRRLGA